MQIASTATDTAQAVDKTCQLHIVTSLPTEHVRGGWVTQNSLFHHAERHISVNLGLARQSGLGWTLMLYCLIGQVRAHV